MESMTIAGCEDAFQFRIADIITKKRDGLALSSAEIRHVVRATMTRQIQDCQLGALLMAIRLRGMNPEETMTLTKEMVASGCVLTWPEEWSGWLVDKHSTGGVGDKVSLPLAPALAACGCKVPMISGRGLGHTGGTLDKLESVPGFSSQQSPEQMLEILRFVGCCIVGQSADLVPADKIFYEMRDVTGTVDSLPLITASYQPIRLTEQPNSNVNAGGYGHLNEATLQLLLQGPSSGHHCEFPHRASVMSKKVAESLSALILDVKFGEAAQCPTIVEAKRLAHSLVSVGISLGIPTIALITNMDSPIGRCVGNSLEVIEALECLEGAGREDLRELVTHTGGYLLWLCGQAVSKTQGAEKIAKALDDGSALQCFRKMMEAQGVQSEIARSLSSSSTAFRKASHLEELMVQRTGEGNHTLPGKSRNRAFSISWRGSGTVELIKARPIAEILNALGAGRSKATDVINHSIGAEVLVRVGQHVEKGTPWIRIHYDNPLLQDNHRQTLQNALCITDRPVFTPPSLIRDVVHSQGSKEQLGATVRREGEIS